MLSSFRSNASADVAAADQQQHQQNDHTTPAAPPDPDSPAEELGIILDRIERRIEQAKRRTPAASPDEDEAKKDGGNAAKSHQVADEGKDNQKGKTSPARVGSGLSRFLNASASMRRTNKTTNTQTTTTNSTPPRKTKRQSSSNTPVKVPRGPDFYEQFDDDEMKFVEDLRRMAELVVLGENYTTNLQKQHELHRQREKDRWKYAQDAILEETLGEASETEIADDEKLQLFDLFFERNALALIVDMLSGHIFSSTKSTATDDNNNKSNNNKSNNKNNLIDDAVTDQDKKKKKAASVDDTADDAPSIRTSATEVEATTTSTVTPTSTTTKDDIIQFLPPLSIATQALQSISILIQNVSRATSLYVILSNNYINKLIQLPLSKYTQAEQRRLIRNHKDGDDPTTLSATTSPGIVELATHFVTFLKSLAMRMNAETLQFFLKYKIEENNGDNNNNAIMTASSSHFSHRKHHHHNNKRVDESSSDSSSNHRNNQTNNAEEDDDDDQTTAARRLGSFLSRQSSQKKSKKRVIPKVDFPLYERALEFCAAHQDSFVRTTAMNICLNTLRLTTIAEDEDDDDDDDLNENSEDDDKLTELQTMSPDGVLHNAKPLPLLERLTIAQYACRPSRVEHLIAPIFTKLANYWSAIDEQIQTMDSNRYNNNDNDQDGNVPQRNEKVAQARNQVRRDRMFRAFKDRVADLQDELLFLDDVFKVGLTVLNEQMIEMMMATFVYPLLLQPLLQYCRRLSSLVDEDRFSFSEHPFGGISADLSDIEQALLPVSGPAKAALLTLASAFTFLSNHPLLRLLYTVLFHPLSPDSTSAPTVRSELEVASVSSKGRTCIRLDRAYGDRVPNQRDTYAFGTSLSDRRRANSGDKAKIRDAQDDEKCVFVLAPALAEVLEFTGEDMSLIARTRPNSYRTALLKCLTVPEGMSDVRELAICVFDAALSKFDGSFCATIIFGTDLKTFEDDMPVDERNLDSVYAHSDDRGIGGSVEFDSRRTLQTRRSSVGSDLVGEVVTALCSSLIFAQRVTSCDWKLCYDDVAAHALLVAVQYHPGAIVAASKIVEKKWREAAVLLAESPGSGLLPMGGAQITLFGAPSINDPAYEDHMFQNFLNLVFYDTHGSRGNPAVQNLVQLAAPVKRKHRKCYALPISCESNTNSLYDRVRQSLIPQESSEGQRIFDEHLLTERREGARFWLQADALLTLLKDLSATGGVPIRNVDLSGIAFAADGSVVDLEPFDTRSVYANVSSIMTDFLFSECYDSERPEPKSTMNLVGVAAIPCVCEVAGPALEYFSDMATGVVSEGVTWQSLFVVFQGQFLVLVQPFEDLTSGRVISVCHLERINLDRDMTAPDDGSPARRLSLRYSWYDTTPPILFLFDAVPELEEHGPFHRIKPFTSRLDLWFEDERSASYAFDVVSMEVFAAKAQRGRRIEEFLNPTTGNDDGRW